MRLRRWCDIRTASISGFRSGPIGGVFGSTGRRAAGEIVATGPNQKFTFLIDGTRVDYNGTGLWFPTRFCWWTVS